MMMKSAVCVLAFFFAAEAAKTRVSPVQKVIELLDQLKTKVQADLDAEGKAQDEYSSWCDTEIGDTGFAIKTAGSQIEGHQATIEESQSQIAAKEAEIGERGTTISDKEKELADAEGIYKKDKADGDAEEQELINSIDELAGAVVQLKKGASFVQVQKRLQPVADVLGRIVDAASVNVARKRTLNAFIQSQTEDKEDADLTFNLAAPQGSVDIGGGGHSDGIMSTLEDMKGKAEDQLSAVRKAAMDRNHNYDMLKMSVNQEIKNQKDMLASAAATKASTGEDMGKAKGELVATEKSKAADEAYLAETKMACETKAAEWDERQKDAAGEMGAIAKAKEILEEGVTAFAQVSVKTRTVEEADMDADVRDRLLDKIHDLRSKFRSFMLAQLENHARNDPFEKLKGMIGEMVEKLLKEANEEAEQKAFCDTEIGKSRKSQQDKTMKLDKATARIDSGATAIAELNEAIKTLEKNVALSDEAVAEATAIREKEHTDFLKASKDFKDSAAAVAAAVQVLKDYYEGAFIQISAKTRRASSMQTEFGGKSETGGTIISVLEIAESDFTKLLAEAETAEEVAAKEFSKLSQESQVSKASKEAEVKGKESEIKNLEVSLQNYREDKESNGAELDAVMAYLDKLKPQCESKAMSAEEKVARREAEIEGLKEALNILNGQDVPVESFMQKRTQLRLAKRVQ